MSKWNRDAEDVWRDLVIAWKTEEYREEMTTDALADLKRRRRA